MKSILFYFLQSVLASGILYGYYHLALRNKKFHQYNRFYLLGSVIISILIPFLQIPLYFEETEMKSSVVLQTLQTISSPVAEPESVVPGVVSQAPASFNWNIALYGLYLLAIAMMLTRILFSLRKIRLIIKNHPVEELDGIRFINTTEPGTPYSFFRWLFWNKKIELRSEKGEQIFRHEIFHIQQKHSLDILFMELVTAIFWINPFFHLIKREQKAIHEFLADQFALRKTDKWEYAELLLMQALSTQQHLVNPFFHNQIKRRIAMITNPQKTSHRYLRKILVLPITAAVMILFAFTYKNKDAEPVTRGAETITIVVDAGHGGIDQGVKSPDNKYTEAQLNLELAKKIQALAGEYNVNVIMTRTDDNLPGGATTINQGLINRANIVNSTKPGAFISVHINATGKQVNHSSSGIEAYITKDRSNAHDRLLASTILKEMAGVYNTRMEIRQRKEAAVFILDKTICPAVLLECGYMSNPDDLAFITESKNQEKIARAILSGLVKYADGDVGYNGITPTDSLPSVELWLAASSPSKKSPTTEQLKKWADGKIYGVWLDGKRIANTSLENYKPADFGIYFVSKLEKNATNYGKHYYQVDLMTHNYYEKAYGNHDILLRRTAFSDTTHPLIVIDGKARPGLTISGVEKEISASDIVSINVLKALAAAAKYGKAGKNGVIEIFIKKDKVAHKDVIIPDRVTDKQDNKVFERVEIEPGFPGGEKAWMTYLGRNINPDIPIHNKAPEGTYTVVVQFIVNTDGSLSDIKALTNHGYGMEEEAIRVVKKSGKWIPAIQNGKPVNAYRKHKLTFAVTGENKQPVTSGSSLNEAVVVGYKKTIPENLWTSSPYTPKISISELKKTNPFNLMGLPEEAILSSFTFTIDIDRDVTTITNTGDQFNEAIQKLINNTQPGHMLTMEDVVIVWNGKKQKIPSRFYAITD